MAIAGDREKEIKEKKANHIGREYGYTIGTATDVLRQSIGLLQHLHPLIQMLNANDEIRDRK